MNGDKADTFILNVDIGLQSERTQGIGHETHVAKWTVRKQPNTRWRNRRPQRAMVEMSECMALQRFSVTGGQFAEDHKVRWTLLYPREQRFRVMAFFVYIRNDNNEVGWTFQLGWHAAAGRQGQQ